MNRKVTVVGGAGNVGSTVARCIADKELADVVIVDIAGEKATADAHPNGAQPWRWPDYVGKLDGLTAELLPAAERQAFLAAAQRVAELPAEEIAALVPALPTGSVIPDRPTGEGIFDQRADR